MRNARKKATYIHSILAGPKFAPSRAPTWHRHFLASLLDNSCSATWQLRA